MAKAGSIVVSVVALVLGLVLGAGGLLFLFGAGSFVSVEREQSNGVLGLFGGSGERATVDTAPWVALIVALVGVALLLFGFRGLYVTFEGREA